MAEKVPPTKQELDDGAEARVAARMHEASLNYQAMLAIARRIRLDMGKDAEIVASAIRQAEDEFAAIIARVGGKIVGRARPAAASTETFTVYVDECGQHSLRAKDPFKAFAVAAVIVSDKDADSFDRTWKAWKRDNLGSEEKLVHEQDIRSKHKSFWCDGDENKRANAVLRLPDIIGKLEFLGICSVIHREKYVEELGDLPLNSMLPNHAYTMSFQFLAERIALALQHNYGGAKARLVLEARGSMEDAQLQYEFARLFLDGTAYLSSAFFRHHFFPGLQFKTKKDNVSGLQLADLLARPCAEKVIAPESNPPRWEAFKAKLVPGRFTQHSILGLKVLPWNECYECMLPE